MRAAPPSKRQLGDSPFRAETFNAGVRLLLDLWCAIGVMHVVAVARKIDNKSPNPGSREEAGCPNGRSLVDIGPKTGTCLESLPRLSAVIASVNMADGRFWFKTHRVHDSRANRISNC
jgi:hypothetical protein